MPVRHPGAQTVQQVLDQAPSLARLTQLLAQSKARLAAIGPLIPGAMRTSLQPGPIDELPDGGTRWIIFAANAGVAAKLRQLQPLMLQRLEAAGLAVAEIKIQIQAPTRR